MDTKIQTISNGPALPWAPADERRLRALVLAMIPYSKILAEFPDHTANAVREALRRFFADPDPRPAEHALQILGGRAQISRRFLTGFTLDGRPASVAQLVDAANRVLKVYGRRPIAYPEVL